jgi:hypothetical protein
LSEGKKVEAGALMARDGEYTKISDQLVATMVEWKESVHRARGAMLSHHIRTL